MRDFCVRKDVFLPPPTAAPRFYLFCKRFSMPDADAITLLMPFSADAIGAMPMLL